MKRFIIIFYFILFSCLNEKNNLIIDGNISGVKNSYIYLSIVESNKIVDSSKVVNGKFTLETFINEPLEMCLILDKKNSDDKFNFISEPANILFTSSKKKFEFNGKIENSSLNSEFEKLKSQINKYEDKDLEMLGKQIEASIEKNEKKYDSLNKERVRFTQKKILFIVNYCVNNNMNNLSPYLAYKYKENINYHYLENIFRNLSEEMKKTYYGSRLISNP